MTSRGFADGLDALAALALDCDKKDEARDFILSCVNDKKSIHSGWRDPGVGNIAGCAGHSGPANLRSRKP